MQNKLVVNIQGVCTYISKHYEAFLPYSVIHSTTIRDFLKKDNIYQQKKKFNKRGLTEKKVLQITSHIIGRTTWDKACISQINPHASYYNCNEIMRKSFYEHTWSINNIEPFSIFISQSYYPLKGFHILLEACSIIVTKYPKLKIYTTGIDPFSISSLKISSYHKYLKKLIKKYGLKDNVNYLGTLEESDMCRQYLKSHVFVSASSIENSSNSLSEAMLLGVPCIASDVGGTNTLLTHNVDGYLYQADAPYMLAYYIESIFKNNDIALTFSQSSREHALNTHNPHKVLIDLEKIYKKVIS